MYHLENLKEDVFADLRIFTFNYTIPKNASGDIFVWKTKSLEVVVDVYLNDQGMRDIFASAFLLL